MFHRTDEELPRTNNSVERWHRRLQSNVSACYPTLRNNLEVLKKEETVVGLWLQAPHQTRRYADRNQRILRTADDYPNQNRIPKLFKKVSLNLAYWRQLSLFYTTLSNEDLISLGYYFISGFSKAINFEKNNMTKKIYIDVTIINVINLMFILCYGLLLANVIIHSYGGVYFE